MTKVEVTIDEKWPVFSFTEPKLGKESFQYDIPDEMYKDYLYITRRYIELQLQLQVLYEESLRKFNGKSFEQNREAHEYLIRDDAS